MPDVYGPSRTRPMGRQLDMRRFGGSDPAGPQSFRPDVGPPPDVDPPGTALVSGATRARLSRQAGYDSFDFSFSADEACQAWQVRAVPSVLNYDPMPTAPVLDAFAGTAAALPASAWTNLSSTDPMYRDGAGRASPQVDGWGGVIRAGLSVSDCEAYLDTQYESDLLVLTRAVSLGTGRADNGFTGYYCYCNNRPTGIWSAGVKTSGGFADLLTGDWAPLFAGGTTDVGFGLQSVGSSHTVWYRGTTGKWTPLGSFTDATFANGSVGWTHYGGVATHGVDNFGGGAYTAPATAPNGSLISSGGALASGATQAVTVSEAALEAASAGDGQKIVRAFVQDLAGNWG